jgi:hypothetical protein
MKHAELIVVRTTTVARHKIEITGPMAVETETDFKAIIQGKFDTHLRGVAGYVLVDFAGKLWQAERDPVDPHKPYSRHSVKYHPLAKLFARFKPCMALVLYNPDFLRASGPKFFTSQMAT